VEWGCKVMGFFKKEEIQEKEVQVIKENKPETKEVERNIFRKKNLSLFDVETIQYVIDNFPSMSTEIQSGLNNLAEILESTIDHIEDKSSEIIKKNRDFKLSKAHRDTSIAIYDVVQNIDEYVKWMQEEYEKNLNKETVKPDTANENSEDKFKKINIEEDTQEVSNEIIGEELEIHKDCSLKEPKAFKLDDIIVVVEDWDDLLVKTAEILTKKYRKNKYSNKIVSEIKPVEKKSTQNSFRDTVIEMLIEYKISLNDFKIIIK
jgi:predicted metal-dependent phosphoesterase TrpH